MPVANLLTLIDDIASILDDVAVMSKVAAKKTAGVLGDDLALNAQQVAGVSADRELPVVWGVFVGSLINKAILVPAALAISAFIPWAITPILMLGGAFLCFEGFEKLAHKLLHSKEKNHAGSDGPPAAPAEKTNSAAGLEKNKIRGAVRTDFILSAEIVVIALGTVSGAPLAEQLVVLAIVAVAMTLGVYGIVAGIVKLDDFGLFLTRKSPDGVINAIGRALLSASPLLMKTLSIAGTAAMFMVGGGILAHGIPGFEGLVEHIAHAAGSVPGLGLLLEAVAKAAAGVLAGALVLGIVEVSGWAFRAVTE